MDYLILEEVDDLLSTPRLDRISLAYFNLIRLFFWSNLTMSHFWRFVNVRFGHPQAFRWLFGLLSQVHLFIIFFYVKVPKYLFWSEYARNGFYGTIAIKNWNIRLLSICGKATCDKKDGRKVKSSKIFCTCIWMKHQTLIESMIVQDKFVYSEQPPKFFLGVSKKLNNSTALNFVWNFGIFKRNKSAKLTIDLVVKQLKLCRWRR